MDGQVYEALNTVFTKLSQAQRDDIESQYENLRVLWERAREDHDEKGHRIALELALTQVAYETLEDIAFNPPQRAVGTILDILLLTFNFGYQTGKAGWPIPKHKCEEVHDIGGPQV